MVAHHRTFALVNEMNGKKGLGLSLILKGECTGIAPSAFLQFV